MTKPKKIGLVLSSGGLRGAAHLGVLSSLVAHGIDIDVMVGVSAGAIVSAFYAAVGISVDELIHEAKTFQGRHLLFHGLSLRLPEKYRLALLPRCGVIPERLRQLEAARFDELKFNVKGLGIVCHDLSTGRPAYFTTFDSPQFPLSSAVRASASIPVIIPSRRVRFEERNFRLTDGGLSDSLPVGFAKADPLGATHLIVSDCRSQWAPPLLTGDHVVYLQHPLKKVTSLRSPRESLVHAVEEGKRSVTPEVIAQIRAW